MRRGLIAILILIASSSAALCRPDRYSQVLDHLHRLQSDGGRARVTQIGKSAEGRSLYAITITDPANPETIATDRARVLFICGQHGDESSSVTAMTNLAENLSHTQDPMYASILKKTVVVIVPVVNPDGFGRFRRLNALGADLNRDWARSTQHETRAITRLAADLKPQIIVDEHEWLDGGPGRRTSVEVADYGQKPQYKLARLLASSAIGRMAQKGVQLNTVHYLSQANGGLAHRHFAASGICSMLIETTPDLSPTARTRVYTSFAKSLLMTITFPPNQRIPENLHGLANWLQPARPAFASLYLPQANKPSVLPSLALLGFMLFAALVVRVVCSGSSHKERLHPMVHPRVRLYALPITSILEMDASPRQKRAILREYRQRPTDRTDTLRKPIADTPVLLDPFENRAADKKWDSDIKKQIVIPAPSPEERQLTREYIVAHYLSSPDLHSAA